MSFEEWTKLAEPEVKLPTTVTLYVPAGVAPPPFPMLLPPPQPDHVINVMSTQKKASPQSILPFRLRGLRSSTSPGKPDNASPSASIVRPRGGEEGYARLADVPAVVTATVTGVGVAPLSVTELGETEHVDCAGAPLQVSATVRLNPPPGATATV